MRSGSDRYVRPDENYKLGLSTGVSLCVDCGSVAWSEDVHNAFHDRFTLATRQADRADTLTRPIGERW